MSRTRTVSRRLLPIVGLATLAFGVVAGGLVWRRHAARVKALAVLDEAQNARLMRDEVRAAAERALEISPGLEEPEAALAAVAAWRGDLPTARALVTWTVSDGPWQRRGRAWLAFREGSAAEALPLLEATPFDEDLEWIEFASGGSIPRGSSLARFVQKWAGDPSAIRGWCKEVLSSGAGTDAAQLARRLLARIETIELHDAAAEALLREAELQPQPFDRSVAALARAEIAAIRSGSDVGVEAWKDSTDGFRLGDAIAILDRSLTYRALACSRHELRLYELFARESDRDRALARVRRALALPVGSPDERLAILARGRAFEPAGDDARKRALVARLGAFSTNGSHSESARLLLALGDEAAASKALEIPAGTQGPGDPLIIGELRALFETHRARDGPRFWFSALGHSSEPGAVCGPEDEAAAASAVRSFALGRPWEASAFLERCGENVHPHARALALARTDPVRALALWTQRHVQVDDPTLRAFAAFLDDTPAVLAGKLQAVGLSGNRAQEVAGVIDTVRSELKRDGFLEDESPAPAASSAAR